MGKRYHNLWPQVIDWENLVLAWRKARKGKRGKPPAATFELNAGENLLQLQRDLEEKTYRPGTYRSFTIHKPKRRLISAAPFRDRVVHHALCNVIEPLFDRRHPCLIQ
jgi:RNA-directed DNA polymerase